MSPSPTPPFPATRQGDGLARADWSIPDGTDGVILELGANDALRGLAPEDTKKNLDAILARLKERKIPVLLVGMQAPPNLGPDYAARSTRSTRILRRPMARRSIPCSSRLTCSSPN